MNIKCPICKKIKKSVRVRFAGKEYINDPEINVPVQRAKTLIMCDDCAKKLGIKLGI